MRDPAGRWPKPYNGRASRYHFCFSQSLSRTSSRRHWLKQKWPLRGPLYVFGGSGGIRTPGTLRYNGFQDRRVRPLCHTSGTKIEKISSARCKARGFLPHFMLVGWDFDGLSREVFTSSTKQDSAFRQAKIMAQVPKKPVLGPLFIDEDVVSSSCIPNFRRKLAWEAPGKRPYSHTHPKKERSINRKAMALATRRGHLFCPDCWP